MPTCILGRSRTRGRLRPRVRRTTQGPSAMFDNLRIIDLSVPLENSAVSEPIQPRIRYVTHEAEGLAQMRQFFGVKPEDLVLSNGLGWALEEVQAITHTGTHVDAP